MPGEKRPLDYYQALYAIANEVDSAVVVEKEMAALVKSTTEALGAKGCSILILTEDQRRLVHMSSYGLSSQYIEKGLLELDPVTAEALKGRPIIVEDATTDPRVQYQAEAKAEGIAMMVSLPLMIKRKVAGVLRVYTDHRVGFSDRDIAFLTGVANLGATAISRDQYHTAMEQHFEQTLQEKAEELARITEAKNRLMESVSVIAHDLKSPLAAIQSYFSVLLGGYAGDLNEKQRQMIERSSIRIEGLLNLISDLLDISRIEMGQMSKEMESVSLADIVKGPVDDIGAQINQQKIDFTLELAPDLPSVFGSPARLKQVFNNLLGNAIKFTPPGGAIKLKISEGDGKIICIVQDSGIGVPAQDAPHIFEGFYRASNAGPVSGTGLGLSIVGRIIAAHGGDIRVCSPCPETGVGTEFVFTLPVTGVSPQQQARGLSRQSR